MISVNLTKLRAKMHKTDRSTTGFSFSLAPSSPPTPPPSFSLAPSSPLTPPPSFSHAPPSPTNSAPKGPEDIVDVSCCYFIFQPVPHWLPKQKVFCSGGWHIWTTWRMSVKKYFFSFLLKGCSWGKTACSTREGRGTSTIETIFKRTGPTNREN